MDEVTGIQTFSKMTNRNIWRHYIWSTTTYHTLRQFSFFNKKKKISLSLYSKFEVKLLHKCTNRMCIHGKNMQWDALKAQSDIWQVGPRKAQWYTPFTKELQETKYFFKNRKRMHRANEWRWCNIRNVVATSILIKEIYSLYGTWIRKLH